MARLALVALSAALTLVSTPALAQEVDLGIDLKGCRCGSADADSDGLTDQCEWALARAFAPTLLFEARERNDAHVPHWLVERLDHKKVRIVYALSYLEDIGIPYAYWNNRVVTAALLTGPVNIWIAHDGDSELVAVDAAYDELRGVWRAARVYMSAHLGSAQTDRSAWYLPEDITWVPKSGAPASFEVYVALNKHANYPSAESCLSRTWSRAWLAGDICSRGRSILLNVEGPRNLGSDTERLLDRVEQGACPGDCRSEQYWTERRFCGWRVPEGQSRGRCVNANASYARQFTDLALRGAGRIVPPNDGLCDSDADGGVDDAGVTDMGSADTGVTTTFCGPGTDRTRFRIEGDGSWDDLVTDTVTGLVWHRDVEHTLNDPAFPGCGLPRPPVPREEIFCCNDAGGDRAVPPGCNWRGFKFLCERQGWRLATVDELQELGNNAGLCFENWSSWSAATGDWMATVVSQLGVAVGKLEYSLPPTAPAPRQAFPFYVRCVRD